MEIEEMLYSRYKKHYADCRTVPGSYNADLKTIRIYVPEGRMKPSGVRGRCFWGYQFKYMLEGCVYHTTYRAVSEENAKKRLLKDYPEAVSIQLDQIFR